MKRIALFFIMIFSLKGNAQIINDSIPNKIYCTVSFLSPGYLSYPKSYGTLNVKFPYSTTDKSGVTSQNLFNASVSNPFTKNSFVLGMCNIEIGTPEHFINFNCAINPTYSGSNFALGYGYVFYLSKAHLYLSNKQQNKYFIFKLSLNLAFYSFGSNDFGSIDNKDKYIYLLGYTANPSWTENAHSKSPRTYQAQSLNLSYQQNDWGMLPKLTIGNNPFKKKIHFEISVSYFIPVFEKGGLSFYQTDGNQDGNTLTSSSVVGLNKQNISATYNNKAINSAPFHFPSLFISLGIGYNWLFITHPKKYKNNRN